MSWKRNSLAAAALFVMLAAPAAGEQRAPGRGQQDAQQGRSPALTRLVDCRALTSPAERLACFDREVAAIDAAEANRELVIMDRQQIRSTRRSLFGLSLPNLGVFSDDDDREEEASRIETTVRSARQLGDGRWMFVLADGARWMQTDTEDLNVPPREGHSIRIRRAAMGSYLANVNNQTAIRVRRVN